VADRVKSNQDKNTGRSAKQNAAGEELRKYNQRLEQAKERQARYARQRASQTKVPAQPLPTPQYSAQQFRLEAQT
jgi:transglutaminase/protease-like cytokinesis protein 3